jgi:heat shock protein HslJ
MEKNNNEGVSNFNHGSTILILIIAVVVFSYIVYRSMYPVSVKVEQVADHKNSTYIIDGVVTKLTDGRSVVVTDPVLEISVTTQSVGIEALGDFDKDGREDVAFVVTQDTGGSGTFYYLLAALNKESGYVGSDSFLLGDRILPQNIVTNGNIITVNYTDRKPTEDFTVAPSVPKNVSLIVDPTTLKFGQVVDDFEGEADPSRMTLTMKSWNWIGTYYGDGRIVEPRLQNKFTLVFKEDSSFSVQTDCNGIGGEYTVKDSVIILERMMSTLMYCEGSKESEFSQALNQVNTYKFTSKGYLLLILKDNKGVMTFR